MNKKTPIQPTPDINALILTIRDQKVLLDANLALIYGVPTRILNQALKRNASRFPSDFAFQLSAEELEGIRSQPVIASERNIRCLARRIGQQQHHHCVGALLFELSPYPLGVFGPEDSPTEQHLRNGRQSGQDNHASW